MMNSKRRFPRVVAGVLAVAAAGLVPVATSSTPTVQAQAACADTGAGGEFFPILDGEGEPTVNRVLKTGDPALDVAPLGKKQLNRSFTVQIAGRGGVPADNVLAVVANITVAQPTAQGNLSVGAAGSTPWPPQSSLLNFGPGHNVPNSQIIALSEDGRLGIHLFGATPGSANVLIDVSGFIATSCYDGTGGPPVADGARIIPVEPARFLNTFKDIVPSSWKGGPLGERESIELPIRGRSPVPNSADVIGVVLNLTGVNNLPQSRSTHLAVTPELVPPSASGAPVSSTNLRTGLTKANLVFAPLSPDGSVFIYNRWGRTDVVADVVGYITKNAPGARAGRVLPLEAPFRSFNTQKAEFGAARLPQAAWEDWSYDDFVGSVKYHDSNTSVGSQLGFVGNLTGVGMAWVPVSSSTPTQTHLAVQPGGPNLPSGLPSESTVNFARNQNVANSTLVRYGSDGRGDDHRVSIFNRWGRSHYIMDVYAVILDD